MVLRGGLDDGYELAVLAEEIEELSVPITGC
jgi:hypothetical protein